jgi:hypothetical protein
VSEPLPLTTLAWLRQSAAVDGAAFSQVLLHLLERVEALEHKNRLDVEAWASMRRAGCDYQCATAYAADYSAGANNERIVIRSQLLAIADELEGQP